MKALIDAVAATDLTILLSSHVVAELERVCDHLVLLRDGRVRLAGDIDDLLDNHRVLTGPRGDHPEHTGPVITASHGERHSNLLVRIPADAAIHPRWQSQPVSLEDLVLGYLEPGPVTTAVGKG
jgi:ABC-2 type transport system ATP-binding protein